jgi:hypothetical protein
MNYYGGFLALLIGFLPAAYADGNTRVSLRLPNVQLIDFDESSRKAEASLSAEIVINGSSLALKDVQLHTNFGPDVTVAPEAMGPLKRLFLEIVGFQMSTAFLHYHLELMKSQSFHRHSPPKVQKGVFGAKSLEVWEIPLRIEKLRKGEYTLTEVKFVLPPHGKIASVRGVFRENDYRMTAKEVDLNNLVPQMATLNPWDHLEWLCTSHSDSELRVTKYDLVLAQPFASSGPAWVSRCRDEAEQIMNRTQIGITLTNGADTGNTPSDDLGEGCAGCGCLTVAAGAAVYIGYKVLTWLF